MNFCFVVKKRDKTIFSRLSNCSFVFFCEPFSTQVCNILRKRASFTVNSHENKIAKRSEWKEILY